MDRAGVIVVGIAAASMTLACASQPAPSPVTPSPPPMTSPTTPHPYTLETATAAAKADAARVAGVAESALALISAEAVTWPDGSLGCPMPGMVYPQVLVPGFRIRLASPAGPLDYHASARGGLVLCPGKRATRPVPGVGVNPRI